MRLPSLLLLLTLATPATLHAQQSWQRVQALPPGTSIVIHGKPANGDCAVQSVTPDTLTCIHSGAALTLQRADITSIRIRHRARSAVAGAAILGGAGAVIGAASDTNSSINILSRGEVAALFAVPLAILGALIGFFTDFTHSTIYHS